MGINNIKKKKIRYRTIIFKVTDKQKQIIDDYCKKNSLGTVQLFKLALREYIERNTQVELNSVDCSISENQLTIFDVIGELEQVD